jgi:bifunctional DNA-binding transcriptional regulator/antitoxin component of YhaV-PrlF toxin-antitoxin module
LAMLELDEKGRLTLPKLYRRELGIGRKVLLINAGDHLKVIAVPSDPVKALRGAFTVKKSFRKLRKQAEALMEREIAGTG